MVPGGMPTKLKFFVVSAASRIPAGGPKWRMVSAEIRWPRCTETKSRGCLWDDFDGATSNTEGSMTVDSLCTIVGRSRQMGIQLNPAFSPQVNLEL